VPDSPITPKALRDLRPARHVGRRLAHRLGAVGDVQARPEESVDAFVEVEQLVPRVELLVEMRQMHVRAFSEVARPEIDVTEGLEVDDLARSQALRLCRREAEEELGRVRDQLGAWNACGQSHLLRQAAAALEAAAGKALANRRDVEEIEFVEERLRTVGDVVEVVAPKQHRNVVLLEQRRVGVAHEPARRKQRRLGRAPVERKIRTPRRRNEPLEVRQSPGKRDSEARGRRREPSLEIGESRLERPLCIGEIRAIHAHAGGDDLVMERRHRHLDVVVRHRLHAVEHVLLRRKRTGRAAIGRRAGEPVDELVGAGHAKRAGRRTREDLAPRELHAAGRTSTRLRRMRVTLRFT
jgi:hypothetical protein